MCVANALCGPNLVPESPNLSPDYFCTWNIQGYVCSYESGEAQRRAMTEENMFGGDPHQRWVDFFPKVRKDLIFVMDDSWDIPLNEDKAWFGSAVLNEQRFPSYTGSPSERLRKLTDAVKAAGWRGLGGWICAQRAPKFETDGTEDAYWTERLEWMRDADFTYWKVDWGKHDRDAEWRRKLTDLGHKIAPHTVIEHALAERSIDFADVYRTYDIENVISAPVTIDRIATLLEQNPKDSPTLINCEDEPYIAAGTGSAIGVMRHPFAGSLPDGRQDFVFPPNARDLKGRLDEVTRAIRWHRIAAPIPLGTPGTKIDPKRLDDHWILEKDETYTPHKIGDRREASAPARISRGLDLPKVEMPNGEESPFVLASKCANGAVAISTIGRATGREYVTPKARVTLDVGNASGPIGIFGVYRLAHTAIRQGSRSPARAGSSG